MAELKSCPFCGGEALLYYTKPHKRILLGMAEYVGKTFVACNSCSCVLSARTKEEAENNWNKRFETHKNTPKERVKDKPKITCLNCKHLMFSDMYGECNKQLRIVNPSDTCEYAEPKERGGEK